MPAAAEAPAPVVIVDRFGFVLSTTSDRHHQQVNVADLRKEAKRCEKWRKMLYSSSTSTTTTKTLLTKKFQSRVAKGIPEPFRGLAWIRMEQLMPSSSALQPPLLAQAKTQLLSLPGGPQVYDNISKDLGRTLPTHSFFRNNDSSNSSTGRLPLERVLCAYACADMEVGFTQGMSFIAALFLLYMGEEHASQLFHAVMQREPCMLRDLFLPPRMEGVHLRLFQYSALLEQHLPRVASKFALLQFDANMYAVNWFASVFTASQFPFAAVVRIWDQFLLRGWPAVFSVTIAFWSMLERRILDKTCDRFEQVFELYRSVLASGMVVAPFTVEELFVRARRIKISEKDLVRLAARRRREGAA